MKRIRLADISSTLSLTVLLFVGIGSVVGAIAYMDSRYLLAAEGRQIQGSINEILLSQLYAERRDILRISPSQRSQRDKDRLEELNRKIAALGGK